LSLGLSDFSVRSVRARLSVLAFGTFAPYGNTVATK
jgi:hypothetical protein